MKEFKAFEFLRSTQISVLIDVINFWEEDRCAEEYESVYNLLNESDFNMFVKQYGFSTAINYLMTKNFYVLGGLNFKEPKPLSYGDMVKIINDEFDEEFFIKCYLNGHFNYLDKWFDVKAIEYGVLVPMVGNQINELLKSFID